MKLLENQCRNIRAHLAAKQTIGQIFKKIDSAIEDKILLDCVPAYSIRKINNLSSNLVGVVKIEAEINKDDMDFPSQQPKPIKFDKQMSRSCHFSLKSQRNNSNIDMSETLSRGKSNAEEENKSQWYRNALKQKVSKCSFELSLNALNNFSKAETLFRRRKIQEQLRRQYDENVESINNTLKSATTEKDIGALLSLRKDYTYDYNGTIIPVTKLEKTFQSKVEVQYYMSEKKQRVSIHTPKKIKIKSKLRRTQIKLQQSENCFNDSKSPFYKNFDFRSKRLSDNRYENTQERNPLSQAPNYMRILTQEGGIKKRYARYKTQGSVHRLSLIKQKMRQSITSSQVLRSSKQSDLQKTFRNAIESVSDQKTIEPIPQQSYRIPSKSRIKVLNQTLKQKIINTSYNIENSFFNSKRNTPIAQNRIMLNE